MKIINPTFGTDFEMFVRNIETKEIVPCPTEFGGSKDEPLSIGDCGFGECFRQIDNCLAEFNIPPVTTVDQWKTSIQYCIDKGNEILFPLGLELVAKSSHVFREEQFTLPRHTKFGCQPSICAYDFEEFEIDYDGPMRSAGMHIHIGFKAEDIEHTDVQRLMYCMDKCVGIPCLDLDDDDRRRELYGKAGDFRDKFLEDGTIILEYRTIGGAMVEDPTFLFNATKQAIELFNSDYVFSEEELLAQQRLINNEYVAV